MPCSCVPRVAPNKHGTWPRWVSGVTFPRFPGQFWWAAGSPTRWGNLGVRVWFCFTSMGLIQPSASGAGDGCGSPRRRLNSGAGPDRTAHSVGKRDRDPPSTAWLSDSPTRDAWRARGSSRRYGIVREPTKGSRGYRVGTVCATYPQFSGRLWRWDYAASGVVV